MANQDASTAHLRAVATVGLVCIHLARSNFRQSNPEIEDFHIALSTGDPDS